MSESSAVKKPVAVKKPAELVLELEDDASLAEGEDYTLECGLGVRLAPTNTQSFSRAAAEAVRKFGGRKATELSDLKPQKRLEAYYWIAARSTFLGFFDPATEEPCFSVKLKGTGEVLSFEGNTEQNRIEILRRLPAIRSEINERIGELSEEWTESAEVISGN